LSQDLVAIGRDTGVLSVPRCQNCGAALTGPFCSACGQREHSRIISLGALLKEAIEDFWHVDSRLWRTLRSLVAKPGFLTVEFLAGRRVRYVPPFRLYLVFSILLFLLTSPLRDDTTNFVIAGDAASMKNTIDAAQAALAAKRAEFARNPQNSKLQDQIDELSGDLQDLRSLQSGSTKRGSECDQLSFSIFSWLGLQTRARAACHKITVDAGAGLARSFIDNLPKMMFAFLPLLALVNKVLYLRSRRFYVEHLLFFVHVQVFLFASISAIIIGNWLFALVPGGVHPPKIVSVAIAAGLLAYVYLSLRRVYGQGRFKTFIKFGILFFAYTICLAVTMVIAALYTALTL
jgi:Protein of unknown function (DUF3667)